MKQMMMKAKAGVTLVELLVVILIVTILSVGLLPLLKPFIEQAKYAAEVQPALANIQTKINLYHYEKDQLPCTRSTGSGINKTETPQDDVGYTWTEDSEDTGAAKVFNTAEINGLTSGRIETGTNSLPHISKFIDVDWQDLMGKRVNPSQCTYHVIKGLGAAEYGYAIGVFGDGNGLAKGTGYAVLVLVNTTAKVKVVATWERYKPKKDEVIRFKTTSSEYSNDNEFCSIPMYSDVDADDVNEWADLLKLLKDGGWSFNFEELAAETTSGS